MRIKYSMILLVCFFQYSFCSVTMLSSSPVDMQGSKKDIHTKYGRGNGVTQKSRFGHGVGSHGGGNGGGSGRNGGGGKGSQPNTQTQGGGAHLVPQYAGAANRHPNNNHHRNGGRCIQNHTGTSIVLAAISFAHVLYTSFQKL